MQKMGNASIIGFGNCFSLSGLDISLNNKMFQKKETMIKWRNCSPGKLSNKDQLEKNYENTHFVARCHCTSIDRPMKKFYIYMLVNKKGGTFYTGITSDKNELADGFTKRYNIKILVYYEIYDDFDNAVRREKRLKKWNKDWKIKITEKIKNRQ